MALSDYLINLGVNVTDLNASLCKIMPAKFFNHSNVTKYELTIPVATDTSKYLILKIGTGSAHVKGIKELKYKPLQSSSNILIDLDEDIVEVT